MFVDTVHLKFRTKVPEEQLALPWRRNTIQMKDGTVMETFVYDIFPKGVWIRLKYHPVEYKGRPFFGVEISSLPALIYGINFPTVFDLGEAISVVNFALSNDPQTPDMDISEGIPYRIDFAYDHDVGSHVLLYLEAIQSLNYPRRDRRTFLNRSAARSNSGNNNGVSFATPSDKTITSFYAKFIQCNDPNTRNYLRQETSIRESSRIREILGANSLRLIDITEHVSKTVLRNDLRVLGLDNGLITNPDYALEILKEKHGAKKAHDLIERIPFLSNPSGLSINELAYERGVSPKSILLWQNNIQSAGIVPATINGKEILPPLTIE